MIAEIKHKGSEFYDDVVRCTYPKDDYISALLINDYKAYILSLNKKKRVLRYEYVMSEFINNISFNNFIHKYKKELLYYISDTQFYLINKYNEYIEKQEKSRWI